jgi:hypothetical protein
MKHYLFIFACATVSLHAGNAGSKAQLIQEDQNPPAYPASASNQVVQRLSYKTLAAEVLALDPKSIEDERIEGLRKLFTDGFRRKPIEGIQYADVFARNCRHLPEGMVQELWDITMRNFGKVPLMAFTCSQDKWEESVDIALKACEEEEQRFPDSISIKVYKARLVEQKQLHVRAREEKAMAERAKVDRVRGLLKQYEQ